MNKKRYTHLPKDGWLDKLFKLFFIFKEKESKKLNNEFELGQPHPTGLNSINLTWQKHIRFYPIFPKLIFGKWVIEVVGVGDFGETTKKEIVLSCEADEPSMVPKVMKIVTDPSFYSSVNA